LPNYVFVPNAPEGIDTRHTISADDDDSAIKSAVEILHTTGLGIGRLYRLSPAGFEFISTIKPSVR